MTRTIHALIAAAYAMACVMLAAVLIRIAGVGAGVGWGVAALGLVAMAQGHGLWLVRARADSLARDVTALREASALLADEAQEARARLGQLEAQFEEDSVERHASLVSEMRTLEGLVRTMGSKVDGRLREARLAGGAAPRAEEASRASVLAAVRDALEAGRVDLHLQPTVTLPQRKTAFYEGFTRLRDHRDTVIPPSRWLPAAESAGLMASVDNLLLFRCVQIVRKLAARERRVAIFCNVAVGSLADDEFFPQFLEFVRQNGDLAGSLVFELGQDAFEARNVVAARNMARLADFGFRFSIDKVTTLDLDFAELKRAGVKFIKVPGDLLVSTLKGRKALGLSAAPEVSSQDYANLLAKFGMELIAEKIEDEATVVEVLELDVALGQGHLFGEPRPIRDEFLEGQDARALQDRLRREAA